MHVRHFYGSSDVHTRRIARELHVAHVALNGCYSVNSVRRPMASQPIDRLVRALRDPDGPRSLDELRNKLSPTSQRLRLSYKALGR